MNVVGRGEEMSPEGGFERTLVEGFAVDVGLSAIVDVDHAHGAQPIPLAFEGARFVRGRFSGREPSLGFGHHAAQMVVRFDVGVEPLPIGAHPAGTVVRQQALFAENLEILLVFEILDVTLGVGVRHAVAKGPTHQDDRDSDDRRHRDHPVVTTEVYRLLHDLLSFFRLRACASARWGPRFRVSGADPRWRS